MIIFIEIYVILCATPNQPRSSDTHIVCDYVREYVRAQHLVEQKNVTVP